MKQYHASIHFKSNIQPEFTEALLTDIIKDTEDFQLTDIHIEEVQAQEEPELPNDLEWNNVGDQTTDAERNL